jgi:hypothetical protein
MCVLAGLLVVAATASSAMIPEDARISIDRALNSPTLTIRYAGASAALVELRINGESVGTRSVSADKTAGETNFTIDLSQLRDGDNAVEIRLYDRSGKLVGSDRTNISTHQGNRGPVFLRAPQVGQSVQGTVEISLGFGKELRNVYVSFFVNNDFKKMTNYPPYTFQWDTTSEANGWHEIEAWAIDDSSNTYKTQKTRVFVNNPGGRTDRRGATSSDMAVRTNPMRSTVGGEAGLRDVNVRTGGEAAGANTTALRPTVSGSVSANKVNPRVANNASGQKPITTAPVVATGVKHLTPTGARTAAPVVEPPVTTKISPTTTAAATATTAKATTPPVTTEKVATTVATSASTQGVTQSVQQVAAATNLVRITKGQRLPNLGSFAVVLNSQFVNFDVNPRVDEGVPMTPFRHLLEKAGGTVEWEHIEKAIKANAEGNNIFLQIGDSNATVNDLTIRLEKAPYLERGRTIVPLSFFREVLNVEIEFDKDTGHVLITSAKK